MRNDHNQRVSPEFARTIRILSALQNESALDYLDRVVLPIMRVELRDRAAQLHRVLQGAAPATHRPS
jgi:hypothetical protein